jgi:hypothetical protein
MDVDPAAAEPASNAAAVMRDDNRPAIALSFA